ncbi:MAG: hypothetical protein ACJAQ2_001642 [Vicingaceae bacterium]
MWNISDDVLHYPTLRFSDSKQNKPNVLGVGDSFIQSFYGFYPILDSVFSKKSNLWYYNKTLGWPQEIVRYGIKTFQLDLELELEKRDCVILEMTEENLKMTGYGFIEDVFDHFKGKYIITAGKQALYNKLALDLEIDKQAKKMASIVGYSIPQMKKSLIKGKIKNEWLVDFDYEAEVQKVIVAIKSTPTWLAGVKEKAIRRNESLDKAIRGDAMWVVNKKIGK